MRTGPITHVSGPVVRFMKTHTLAARDFLARRGASDEHTRHGSVRSEQRSLAEKELPPTGLCSIWPVALLLARSSSTADTLLCPCGSTSRLATGQMEHNEC